MKVNDLSSRFKHQFSVETSYPFTKLSNMQDFTTPHLTQPLNIDTSVKCSGGLSLNHASQQDCGFELDKKFLQPSIDDLSYYGNPMMNLTYPAVFGPVETNYSVAAPQTLHHIEAASSAKCYTTLFPHGTVSVPSQYYGTADYTKCPCNNGLTSIATAPLTECHQNATDFSQRAGAVWQTPQMLKPAESVYVAQLPSNLEVMGHGGNGTEAEQRTCHTESNCLIENGSLSFYHRELTSETPVAHSGIHNGSGVDLLVTNLDYNISAKEWRKILFTHLQAIIKNVQSVVLQTQADGSTCAIVRVGSVEEARLAISQFHRKKIGYKRIQMNIMPSTPSFGARGFKMEAVSLLRSVAGNMLPVCKFIDIFEKRFHRSISVSDIYKMRDILEIRDQPGTKGGRVVYLNPRASRFDYIETTFITEPVVCQRHCLEGSMEYLQAMDGAMLPSVKISLGVFRQQVLTILRDHGGSMPLLSFPACYKAEFDDFVIVPPQLSNKRSDTPPTTFGQPEANEDDAGPNHEFFSSHPEQETSTKSKSWSENRTDYEFTAPLEHLITCVPYVRVHTEMNGVRRIVYSPDQSPTAAFPNCPTGQRPIEGGRQSADVPTTIQSNYVPLTIGVSCTNSSTSAVGILQDQLHQFSREVVDLLKHQPECQILLSKFIPSYHHHFGKQCRVADYGYSKLHELIEALPHVVHVMGTGHARLLTLSHRVQVRRFTNELIKVLKSQSTKSCRLADYASLFKRIYRKDFRIRDYGVCYLTDMLMEVPDNAVETLKLGSEYIISLPKRMQTTEERERTELFAVEVAELLGQTPRCRLLFSKFIPSYHHHFSRQCRVADYGFTKLIDLLEAVPHVIQIMEDNGEKYVTLVRQRHLQIVADQLVAMLEVTPGKRILLNELLTEYLKHRGYALSLEDFGFQTVQELVSQLPKLLRIECVSDADAPPVISSLPNNDGLMKDNAGEPTDLLRPTSVIQSDSVERDTPQGNTESEQVPIGESDQTRVLEFVSLADRTHIKHLTHKVLLILLEVPTGALSISSFSERFRCTFRDEPNIRLVYEELGDVIEFRGNMSWTSGKGSFGTHDTWNKSFLGLSFTSGSLSSLSSEKPNVRTTPSKVPERSELSSKDVNSIRACSSDSPSTSTAFLEESHTIIALKPLILFARELRDILRQSQGKLSLAQLCNAYQRRFGIPLRPQRYNYPSLSSLVQAVDFVAVMRGRGVRSTLVLCQDFLGKLSHRVAYSNRPLLESDMVAIPRQGMEPHGNPGAGEENTGRKLEWAQSSNARHSNRINSLAFNEATSDDFVMTSGAIPFETPQRHFSMEPFPPESYDIPNPSCLRLRNYSCVPAFSQCNPYAPPITSSQIASSHYNCCQVPHPQQSSGSQSMYPNRPSYSTPMVLAPQGTLNYLQPTNEFVSTGLSPQTAYRANSSAVYAPSVFPTPTSQSESLTTLPSGSAVQPDPRIIGPGSEISSEGLPYSNSLFTNPSLSQFQLSLSCSSTMNQTGSQAQCAAQPPLISGLTHSIYPKPGTAAPSYGPNPVCLSVTSDSISYKQPPKTLSNHAASSTCQYSLSSDGYQQLDALVERLTSGGSATVSNGDFIQGKTKGNEQNKQQISSSMLPTESDNSSHSTQLKQHFYFSGHRASLFDYPTTSQYQAPLMSSVPNSINGSLPYWTGSPFNGVGAPMAVTSDNYSLCSTNAVNTSYSGASVGSFIPLLNQEGKDCGGGKQGALESGSATVMHYALANKTQAEPPREFDGHMPTQQLMVNMPRQCCNAVSSTNQSSLCANTREHMGSVRGPGEEVNLGCTFPRSETSKTPCHPNAALDIHHNESASIYTSVDGDGVKASGSVTPKNSEALAVPHPPDTTVHIDPMQPQANRSYAMSLRSEESSESFTIDGLLAELKLEERQEEPHQQKQEQEDNEQSQCSECVSEPKQNILLDNLTHL
ncbi:unnamed protein product [Dicrocoelium dendriticum]|nr:unnamed protein product [Dicrocoelium dendriticum]